MASESLSFTVRLSEPELVAPAESTPHEIKELSDVDLQWSTRLQAQLIWFYRSRDMETSERRDPSKVIKEALSRTLVFYYPFAGRIRQQAGGRRSLVECTGEGILFVEADADVRLEQLGDALLPLVPCSEKLLHHVQGSDSLYDTPLLLVQVTRFLCRGFALAIRLNHIMADGAGLVQLLRATAEIARGAPRPSILPVWRRELLQARDPPQVSYAHHEYDEKEPAKFQDCVLRCFSLRRENIQALKKQLPEEMQKITSFDILTACFWRCRVAAFRLDPAHQVRVLTVVTGHGRCPEVVPAGYYGNSIAYPAALSTAGELLGNPLVYAVQLVAKAKSQMVTEYLRSTADLVALKGWMTFTSSVSAMTVSDLRRFSLGDMDFGWGNAVLCTPMDTTENTLVCIPYTATDGEAGTVVMLRLPEPAMEIFAEELEAMIKVSPEESA